MKTVVPERTVEPCGSKERLFQLAEMLGSCNFPFLKYGTPVRLLLELDAVMTWIKLKGNLQLFIANYELNMCILAKKYLSQM